MTKTMWGGKGLSHLLLPDNSSPLKIVKAVSHQEQKQGLMGDASNWLAFFLASAQLAFLSSLCRNGAAQSGLGSLISVNS